VLVQVIGEENQEIDVSFAAIKFYGAIYSAHPSRTFFEDLGRR
jgi:hypothetical protein